jgi:anion-transporting  ArsA/GET3 family ATPase
MVFVTGKGGVGKTTVAIALALQGAAQGRRTILCEVGEQQRAASLLGVAAGADGDEVPLADGLWGTSISPERALREWLAKQLGSRTLTQALTRAGAFQYFVAAAPGVDELVTMTKVWELTREERWDRKQANAYDLVVVDAPASGHGLAMLAAPGTFATVARVGPIAGQAREVADFLRDPARTAFAAVTLPSELPVTETLELEAKLRADMGRTLDAVVANQVLPRRFTKADVARIEATGDPGATRAVHSQAGGVVAQQAQLRRLRAGSDAPVTQLPFVVTPDLDAEQVSALGHTLVTRWGRSGSQESPR